jgi:DNA-binding CsgD family transcriptional regulator
MTTGFDHIFDSLFPSRKRSSPTLELSTDEEVLAMLGELAQEQGLSAPELAAILLKRAIIERYHSKNQNVQNWEDLSPRQQQVAALACLEYTNAEIAEKLSISLETVKTHMREILRKFDVRGRHQLRYMLRRWDFGNFEETPPD